jgi:hypothetical protein
LIVKKSLINPGIHKMPNNEYLTLEVAPHIVQDLGLNLYTSLPRVLVEFIANAHDADSPCANVKIDVSRIAAARLKIKEEYKNEITINKKLGKDGSEDILPLEVRTLPEDIEIIIEDHGHGMSKEDLQQKFLRVGRRRREEDGIRTQGGRILMGRKGLGKLAGFGVAHRIIVISRKTGESHATKICLEYDKLIEKERANDVQIPVDTIEEGADIDTSGTRVILSKLVYDPAKSQEKTISDAIADHFRLVGQDFRILLNGGEIRSPDGEYVYAFPEPDRSIEDLVNYEYESEDGRKVAFSYRIRFKGEGKQLPAVQRGVRIYAHGRLAAAPDLLDLKTGIHGFRNTHYLEAVVHADFIDDQSVDYIATDRHTLRWESPLLEPMRAELTEQMQKACAAYQKVRDEKAEDEVKSDKFTQDLITQANLPKHRERLAYRVAKSFASVCEEGLQGEEYHDRLKIFVDGLSQGDILKTLRDLAAENNPDFQNLVKEITELTTRELGDFVKYVEGRLSAIEALRKMCEDVDFMAGNNEAELHSLLRDNPWLIDPTFTQFLSSNEAEKTMQGRLAKELKIGPYIPDNYDKSVQSEVKPGENNKRPDLVFLLSSDSLNRLIIVELKAPNTPLHGEHLRQLQNYIRRAKKWLSDKNKSHYFVQGFLIGSKACIDTKKEEVEWLNYQIETTQRGADWRVYDILEILDLTMKAHNELMTLYREKEETVETKID